MNRSLLLICGLLSISFVFCICAISNAEASPLQTGGQSTISPKAPTSSNSSQSPKTSKLPGRKDSRQQVPKPDRNRIGDGGGKRRKARKADGKKNSKIKVSSKLSSEIEEPPKKQKENRELKVQTERVDDIPLLIAAMEKMGVQHAIDRHISVQRHQRELSWGYTAVIWLAYILSEGDHRKVSVQEYIRGMQNTLSELTGMKIHELDFADDRLTHLVTYLSKKAYWEKIEKELSEHSIEAYDLPNETARVDATTVSGYHETVEGGIFQFGHSKDDPNRPQIKIMTGSLDPLGMPLATDVVSGEKADDGLYGPVIDRISSILNKEGVLYIGDCKLSSFENRVHIKGEKVKGHYLCPLPNTGKTPEKMKEWIDEGKHKDSRDELIKYTVKNKKGKEELKAKGYELEIDQTGEEDEKEISWKERVLIVKSPSHERQKVKGLEKRLKNAAEKLNKLTPPRGRGKRQITEESTLIEKGDAILKHHKVEGFLTYEYVKEVKTEEKYIGRGRGSDKREKRVEEKVRYQVTKVTRNEEKINEAIKTYGWKAYVTDVPKERLDFVGLVKSYRQQYSVERIFNRLKSRLHIAPLYVKRNDQTKGMTHFLTLGVRVYTLVEFVVRRSLKSSGEKLVGLHLENPKKATDIPTCERLLKAFSKITLTILDMGDKVLRHLPPLSQLQTNILRHLGLNPAVYENLEITQSRNLKTE